ncbi:MAG: hypothetical protein PHS54_01690 [Clostridia bacterium]|nr:hypothetical protein [Clostridia bacterium]
MAKISVTKYCLLPQNIQEQKEYKKFVSENTKNYLNSAESFTGFIGVKYTNSKIDNDKIKDEIIEKAVYIVNAGSFGFCKIDFKTLEKIYESKTFSELANDISKVFYEINNNADIAKHLENGNIEVTLRARIKEAEELSK